MHDDTVGSSFSAGNRARSEAAWGAPDHVGSGAASTSLTLATHKHFGRC